MTTIRSTSGGHATRASVPRTWARPPGLALLGLAIYGLIQSGCASDGCSNCNLGDKFNRGVQAVGAGFKSVGGIFHHKKDCGGGGADCGCGGGMEEGVIVDSGVPMVPGAMAIPAPTLVPAPAIDSTPSQLEAIPSNTPANPTGASGTNPAKSSTSRTLPNGNNRSSYTTMQPKRGSDVAQALHSTPDKAGRSTAPNNAPDLFANIPPVDLPGEVTRKAAGTTPAASTAPTAGPIPTPTAAPAAATDNAAEKVSAAEAATLSLPPIDAITAHQAPGLHRFASVAPSVGGGSAPSTQGLDWLKEKGYRTFLDLRKGTEVDPDFVDAVNDRGMVYISLPILADRLDPTRLARFDDLLSRSENRPLFFCDQDGTRAGLAWYIHLRVVDQEESSSAAAKAEEIGLTSTEARIAEGYLATYKTKARAATAKVAQATPRSVDQPKLELQPIPDSPATSSALPGSNPSPVPAPVAPPAPAVESTPAMLPGEDRPQARRGSAADYRDLSSWRPVAALVLTSIGVPLAFWSRSIFTEYRSVRRRASLPGAKPRSLDAPVGSDA